MGDEFDGDVVVDVIQLGVMVHLFSVNGDLGEKAKGFNEITELEVAVQFAVLHLPRAVLEGTVNLLFAEFLGHGLSPIVSGVLCVVDVVVTRAAVTKRWAILQCFWASLNFVTVYSRGLVRVQIEVMQPKIRAHEVGKTFETTSGMITALEKLSLGIGEGEFVCIVGPSGCGKSTFLRMLAGPQ